MKTLSSLTGLIGAVVAVGSMVLPYHSAAISVVKTSDLTSEYFEQRSEVPKFDSQVLYPGDLDGARQESVAQGASISNVSDAGGHEATPLSISDGSFFTAASGIGCKHTVDNPHISRGAGGVIAKVRVTCNLIGGNVGPSGITVHLTGTIYRSSAGTKSIAVATSQYSQYVPTNGTAVTFYNPRTGNAGTAPGTYRACATITPQNGAPITTLCQGVQING